MLLCVCTTPNAPHHSLYTATAMVPVSKMAPAGGDLDAIVAAIMEHGQRLPTNRSCILIDGSMVTAPLDPPAAHDCRGDVYIGGYAMWQRTAGGAKEDGDEANVAWAKSFRSAIKPFRTSTYIGESMFDEADKGTLPPGCYPPEAYARLRALKAKMDPHGLLQQL